MLIDDHCIYITSSWLHNKIGSVAIPTHMYKIVVKCQDSDQVACNGSATNFKPCGGKLDALAFILPHTNTSSPQCHVRTDNYSPSLYFSVTCIYAVVLLLTL